MKPYHLATIVIQNFKDINRSTVDVLTDVSPINLHQKVLEYLNTKGLQPSNIDEILKDIQIARQDKYGPQEITITGNDENKNGFAVYLFSWEVHYDQERWSTSLTGFTADMIRRVVTYVHIFPAEQESEPYCEHLYNFDLNKVERDTRKWICQDDDELEENRREETRREYNTKTNGHNSGRLFLIETHRPEPKSTAEKK